MLLTSTLRRALLGLILCAPTLFAGGSRAEDSASQRGAQADEAQFHFLRGNRAYQERRYEDALASYYLSNRLVPNRNVEFNIARCLDRLGRYDESYRAWSSLLDDTLPDKERNAVKDAIDQLRPHLALVDVETSPPGATIYAQRRDLGALGTTPKSLALKPGLTKIILERDGYRPLELVAEPRQGAELKLSAVLERIWAEVEIRRVPADAEIRRDFVDGELLRHGPGTFKVLPGSVVLFVSAPGHQTTRLLINAVADVSVPVDALLSATEAPVGVIVVRANATGALVRVDGREAGFVPAVIDGVPAGLREVEILAEGRKTYRAQVEVSKGGRAFVDGYLRRADREISAATKSQVASESAPASISVVTADEIAAFGYTSLTEALAGVRGTFTSNDRSYESVGFRGFSPPGDYTNRVLVLVDGHPQNDAVTGQGYVGHELDVDLSNVDHIEIVRGPGSVLYGTGALFGVINVVTRRPNPGAHAAVSTMAGTPGLASGRATLSARKGSAEVMLSAGALTTEGDRRFAWPSEFDAPPADGSVTPSAVFGADGEHAAHADLLARLGAFSLRASYNDRKKYLPTGAYDTLPAPGTYNHDRRGFAEIRFDTEVHGLGIAARAAYDNSWYHGQFNASNPAKGEDQDLRAQWTTGELRLDLPRFLRQRFTLGGEAVKQFDLETDRVAVGPGIPKDLILSAYVVDTLVLGDRLTINLGLRNDRYTKSFGNTLNPRIAVIARPYETGNTKVFFGRSFRVPSPNERADTPNAAVQPETIWSGEIEHTHTVTDDVQIIGAVFANWIFNLISLVPAPELADVAPYNGSKYQNNSHRIRSLGAEGELRWEPGSGTLLSISVTRQQVEELSADGNRPFDNAPELMAKARVLYPLAGRNLRLGTELVLDSGRHFHWRAGTESSPSDNRTEDALLWNLSISGEYRPYHLRYFLGAFNLLDVHDARSGFPTSVDYRLTLVPRYGRSARAGLVWSF